jgi:hypothetical protein
MNRFIWIAMVPVFVAAAIAGSRSRPAKPVAVPIPGPQVIESPAPEAPEVEPPKEIKVSTDPGLVAKKAYVESITQGKLDADQLWFVFRRGGAGLDALLLERLAEGVADSKELTAIHTEVERFILTPGAAGPLRIGDAVFNQAHAWAASPTVTTRSIAAQLLGTRDTDEARLALWRMADRETDPTVQLAVLETLARIAPPTQESYDRTVALVHSYAGRGKNYPNHLLERLIGAQTAIKNKFEEAYLREHPEMRRR